MGRRLENVPGRSMLYDEPIRTHLESPVNAMTESP
jgi:hypothetical protein